jgi:hypothetical protein
MSGTSRLVHDLGYLVNALRNQCLLADQLVLHLPTFVRSLDLPLELLVGIVLRTASRQGGYSGCGCNEPSRPRKDRAQARSAEVHSHSADKAE